MHPEDTLHRGTHMAAKAVLVAIAMLLVSSCNEPSRPTSPSGKTGGAAPSFTMGMGSVPTTLGQGTYSNLMVKRVDHDWQVQLKAQKGLEVVVRSFAYDAGSFTGWHKHLGPVLIQIIQGTVTFYEADHPCTPIVVHAGEGYLDTGNGHMGRNLTGAPAKDITIYLAPPGTQVSQLRIDMPAPPGAEKCS
jgi:quercetin dioxygenase-like cupin family protein